MKKFLLSASLCCLLSVGAIATATAQEIPQSNLKPSISLQPLWGPTGYNIASYYYLPDIEVYYDIPEKRFIFHEAGKWQVAPALPDRYKNYDLYSGYKVVLNRPHPYFNYEAHRVRYARFKGQVNRQTSIKDSTNPKYFVIEGHPHAADAQASNQKAKPEALKVAGN